MVDSSNKKFKTLMLIYVWITKGLYSVIGGPTMIDLMLTLNLSLEEVARALSGLGIGNVPAVIVCALLTDSFGKWKELVMAIFQTVAAAAVFVIPFINSVDVLWTAFFIVGFCSKVLNFIGNRIIFEMWGEKSPSPMHAMHMGFGIGALLSPLIATPFLAVTSQISSITNVSSNSSFNTTADHHEQYLGTTRIIEESRVGLAYITIAIATFIGSVPFWYMVKKSTSTGYDVPVVPKGHRKSPKLYFKEILNPAAYAEGSLLTGTGILILLFVVYLNAVGGEHSFGSFVRTYSVDVFNFGKDKASYLNLLYWLFHSLGRFFSFIVARYIPIRYLLFAEVVANLISTTAVHLLASKNELSLWIFTAVQGFVVSPIYASGITYTNTQVEMRGIMLMSGEIGAGTGYAFYVWMTGYMYDAHGPRAMLIAVQVSGIVIFAFTTILSIIGHIRGNRFDRIKEIRQTKIAEQYPLRQDNVSEAEQDIQK